MKEREDYWAVAFKAALSVGVLFAAVESFAEGKPSFPHLARLWPLEISLWAIFTLLAGAVLALVPRLWPTARVETVAALALSLALVGNVGFYVNRFLFKFQWLQRGGLGGWEVPAALSHPGVLATNGGLVLLAALLTVGGVLTFLRIRDKWPWVAVPLAVLLVELSRHNSWIGGRVAPSALLREVWALGAGMALAALFFFGPRLLFRRPVVGTLGRSLAGAGLLIATFLWGFGSFFYFPAPLVNAALLHRHPHLHLFLSPFLFWTDRDRDGFSTVIGHADCNDRDPRINILAVDFPGNGIDEDCYGGDLPPLEVPQPPPAARARGRHPEPNILLVTIDALRPDHLGLYGYRRPTSPTLDRLAREGGWFAEAISTSSWTPSSLPSILTSLYPSTHGVYYLREDRLASAFTTLAETLKEAGYETAGFHPYDKDVVGGFEGMAQGFTTFFQDFRASVERPIMPAGELNREVIRWLRGRSQAPFFLYIHYGDIHAPYEVPQPYQDQFVERPGRVVHEKEELREEDLAFMRARYDGGIRYVDSEMEALLNFMRSEGLFEDLLIVVTSDHGESFLEHGTLLHAQNLYQEVIRVPLILRLPRADAFRAGRAPAKVSTLDIAATLWDYLGISPPGPVAGKSLLPLLEGEGPKGRLLFSELRSRLFGLSRIQYAVQDEEHKFILDILTGGEELYHLPSDPGERRDLSMLRPALVRHYKTELLNWKSYRALEGLAILRGSPSR